MEVGRNIDPIFIVYTQTHKHHTKNGFYYRIEIAPCLLLFATRFFFLLFFNIIFESIDIFYPQYSSKYIEIMNFVI